MPASALSDVTGSGARASRTAWARSTSGRPNRARRAAASAGKRPGAAPRRAQGATTGGGGGTCLQAAVQALDGADGEQRAARRHGLDGRADGLEPLQERLARGLDGDRVGRQEREPGAQRERLRQPHPGRTPAASAAAEGSPMMGWLPGSGPSAATAGTNTALPPCGDREREAGHEEGGEHGRRIGEHMFDNKEKIPCPPCPSSSAARAACAPRPDPRPVTVSVRRCDRPGRACRRGARRPRRGAEAAGLPAADPDLDVRLKLEGLSATGSFKDRGAATLIGFLAGAGVERAVADSSGNAGAAIAAHCARAGIALDLYVPASAAPGKLVQARAHGANVIAIDGSRQAAADAAGAAVEQGAVYATHAWSPYFLAGTAGFATELLEQLGTAPDALVLPVGSGTLLLGIWPLLAALPRPPRIYAVQSAACAPLFSATGDVPAEVAPPAVPGRGRAGRPAATRRPGDRRGARLRRTLPRARRRTLGPALRRLARAGVFAEPTAALAAAALDVLRDAGDIAPGESVVCAITGHGLKAPGAVEALLG